MSSQIRSKQSPVQHSKKREGTELPLPETSKKPKLASHSLFPSNQSWQINSKIGSSLSTPVSATDKLTPSTKTATNSGASTASGDESTKLSIAPLKRAFGFGPKAHSASKVGIPSKPSSTPLVMPVEPEPTPTLLSKPTVTSNLPVRYVAEGMSVEKALEKVIPSQETDTAIGSGASRALIVMDSANVSHQHGQGSFSTKGLPIAVEFYKSRGFDVVAFLPDHYLTHHYPDPLQDWSELEKLVKQKILIPTPAADYDDLYIVQFARKFSGIIVSNDRYRDVPNNFLEVKERQEVANWIKKNRISFDFEGDVFVQKHIPYKVRTMTPK